MLDTWFSRIKVLRALDQEMGGGKARKREHQGLEFLELALISRKAWHNEAGVSVVLVIVLGCLLCCSDQWSETGEGLGNLQELML